jgi:hypothetical protein
MQSHSKLPQDDNNTKEKIKELLNNSTLFDSLRDELSEIEANFVSQITNIINDKNNKGSMIEKIDYVQEQQNIKLDSLFQIYLNKARILVTK